MVDYHPGVDGVETRHARGITVVPSQEPFLRTGGLTFTSPYLHPNGRLGDSNTWHSNPRKRFGTPKSFGADAYFRFIRREARVPGAVVGVDNRLVFEVTPSTNAVACGREISYAQGYREDGRYLTAALAGRLFICTKRGTMLRVPLPQDDGELRSGGLHDSLVLVIPDKAGKILERGDWPSEYIPGLDQLGRILRYSVWLSDALRKELPESRYANLLGSRFRPSSRFGEAVVVMTKLLMLQNVAVYHLVDAPRLFVEAYCGVANGTQNLAVYLRNSDKRVDVLRPHAWALGTLSQMLGAVPGASLSLKEYCAKYNRYARNSGPMLAESVLRNNVDSNWLDEVNVSLEELEHSGRESYSAYLARIVEVVRKLSTVVECQSQRASALKICESILDEAMKIDFSGVDVYNSDWFRNGWRVGQFTEADLDSHEYQE